MSANSIRFTVEEEATFNTDNARTKSIVSVAFVALVTGGVVIIETQGRAATLWAVDM